jgi:hypothetical protein
MRKGKEIYYTFIAEGCEFQLNIPALMRNEIEQALREEKLTRTIFDRAQTDIYKMMLSDTYSRFNLIESRSTLTSSAGSPANSFSDYPPVVSLASSRDDP